MSEIQSRTDGTRIVNIIYLSSLRTEKFLEFPSVKRISSRQANILESERVCYYEAASKFTYAAKNRNGKL